MSDAFGERDWRTAAWLAVDLGDDGPKGKYGEREGERNKIRERKIVRVSERNIVYA